MSLRIVYWAHSNLVEDLITRKLNAVEHIEFLKVKTFDEFRSVAFNADGLIMADPPSESIAELGALLHNDLCTVRWVHIITSGSEKFRQTRPPSRVRVTGPMGAHAPVVAEHAMALILSFTRQIHKFADMTARGGWDRSLMNAMSSLEAQTVGILGAGHVGQELAKRSKPFGMNVIACNRTVRPDALFDQIYPLGQLKEFLTRSDFIVVAIASTPETYRLIGPKEFAACKPTAHFINVARGTIVDTEALAQALFSKKIAGAGIDVTDPEPLPPDHVLWTAPNLIISPHASGARSIRSLERLSDRVIENLNRFETGWVN